MSRMAKGFCRSVHLLSPANEKPRQPSRTNRTSAVFSKNQKKINFHQLVSAVGSKKDKIAAGLLVLYAQAASAGDVQAFDKLYTQLTGWAQGSLGKSIAIIFLLVGLAVGLAKGSLYAAVVSIACGLTLMIAPSVIDSIFTV